jgi:hypothetical protein
VAIDRRKPMLVPRLILRTAAAGSLLALLIAAPDFARAQGKFEASYGISVARIPIGSATATAEFGDADYLITMSGRASGMMRVLASGDGTLRTRGVLTDGRPAPTEFTARTTTDDDTLDVKLVIDGGNVTELSASEPKPHPDRVELTPAHRHGIVDPLTALLVPLDGDGAPNEAACRRTIAVFDGRRRFDLKLAFKRMDKVKAERGYAGPVVVCAVTFQPVAGHRSSSTMVKFLSQGRDIEMALAPIAGTRLLAPFRITIVNMLGNLVVQANRFEAVHTAPTTGQGAPSR